MNLRFETSVISNDIASEVNLLHRGIELDRICEIFSPFISNVIVPEVNL
jgi:hypothetical protein